MNEGEIRDLLWGEKVKMEVKTVVAKNKNRIYFLQHMRLRIQF